MVASALNFAPDLGRLILITGPTRSGKSDWAEALALKTQQSVVYIATALTPPSDLEWQARVQAHRDRRPATWTTQEIPHRLTEAIAELSNLQLSNPNGSSPCCILIDALGTWVANELEQPSEQWSQIQAEFLQILQTSPHRIICVAEEVGWGIVPAYPAGRLFRDRLGALVRCLGQLADQVYLVTAGYAVNIKQFGQAVPTHITQNQEMHPD